MDSCQQGWKSSSLIVKRNFAKIKKYFQQRLEPASSEFTRAIEAAEAPGPTAGEEEKITLWQRVIHLGGSRTPAKAFRNLADIYISLGDFKNAEAIVQKGVVLHPDHISLNERLGKIAFEQGFTQKALEHWTSLIERHPKADCGWIYRRMGHAYASEGLMQRAENFLREGVKKYPGDELLIKAHAKAVTLERASMTIKDFSVRCDMFQQFDGTLSLPISLDETNQHLPKILGFEKSIAPLTDLISADEVDVFSCWGMGNFSANRFARQMAAEHGKPLLYLDRGFIASDSALWHSVVFSPGSPYNDATQASLLEKQLNSGDFQLDAAQQARAKRSIEKINQQQLTQSRDFLRVDLGTKFLPSGKKRILLIDESIDDEAVEKGLGSWLAFKRMLEIALATDEYEVIIKVISNKKSSYVLSILDASQAAKVCLIEETVNPHSLFEAVDQVFVCTSLIGFEALLAGREVHCFGAPFYAGWGITQDHIAIPRRKRARSLEEIFYHYYIAHSRYFVPDHGAVELEDLIDYLSQPGEKAQPLKAGADAVSEVSILPDGLQRLRILIIIPSPRSGASGRYLQTLAMSLIALDCKVMILAEGKTQPLENGVRWVALEFEGGSLAGEVRKEITEFAPNIIYENGVRSRAQRATLEVIAMTGARLVMQSEDDDGQVYGTHHGEEALKKMLLLDKPLISFADIKDFLNSANLSHALNVFVDPSYDRWVEPISRALCYRLAELHTAIWHPFAERLAKDYAMPTMVVPPVAARADFERMPLHPEERDAILKRHGIEPHRVVIFIGGALYSYSEEYACFLEALNLAVKQTNRPVALIIASKRSTLPIAEMAENCLIPEIEFADLDLISDEIYIEVLKACDVVCSPGFPDAFNRLRLPSRLVKAMAMAKPILTCRCGFGESLQHGVNAFLMDGTDPRDWADVISASLDRENQQRVGEAGKHFARQHFDSDLIAAELKKQFLNLLEKPARALRDSIDLASVKASTVVSTKQRTKSHIKTRQRYASTMQDALRHLMMQGVALKTVVHVGAGRCRELEDYCRLGAEQILLVEPLAHHVEFLRELESERISVRQAAIAAGGGEKQAWVCRNVRDSSGDSEELYLERPSQLLQWFPALQVIREQSVSAYSLAELIAEISLTGTNDLLVLETLGSEKDIIEATPPDLIRKFEWIALRLGEQPISESGAVGSDVLAMIVRLGYRHIPSPHNYAGPLTAELFWRIG